MKLTPKRIFVGLALLLILAIPLIWLVWHTFNIANIVTGDPN
jgi:hypothetical protein